MVKRIRRVVLQGLRSSGVFRLVRNSQWRRKRLLILCYHGISQEDEHLWRPQLYMPPDILQQRLEILKRGSYDVLPLGEALRQLQAGQLPPRSVVITFDDGGYDFYKQAYPLVKSYGFPVTVYQTTYYSDYQKPVFNLICSYMLWKRRGTVRDQGGELGLDQPMDLRTKLSRHRIVLKLVARCEADDLSGWQKNDLAARLAKLLDIDYDVLVAKRMLQLMDAREIAQLAAEGVDFQLHTHRHRAPADEALFRKEIRDNRCRLEELTKSRAVHFCYPSGVHEAQFIPWLHAEKVVSATTCDVDLANSRSNPLLLPRFVDTSARNAIEFESWLTGVGSLLVFRERLRKATNAHPISRYPTNGGNLPEDDC
jgi:peptidoglycan/xylan/chitin deacetylase (PgdA/CDA1 family)